MAISATAPTLHRFHASGGKIKKSTYSMASNYDQVQRSPSNTNHAPLAGTSSCEVSRKMQTVHLGSDRRYNNYWLFLGPCARDDPGHRMVFFESSEDGHWEVIDTPQVCLLPSTRKELFLVAIMDEHASGINQILVLYYYVLV